MVQALNKLGAGPTSEEVKQYTAEGTPDQPPQDNTCTTLTSQTIRVSWVSPPLITANGVIKGYKVVYGPSDTWYGESVLCTLKFQNIKFKQIEILIAHIQLPSYLPTLSACSLAYCVLKLMV